MKPKSKQTLVLWLIPGVMVLFAGIYLLEYWLKPSDWVLKTVAILNLVLVVGLVLLAWLETRKNKSS
jgi:hypothetical protein